MDLFELYAKLKLDDKDYKKGVGESQKQTQTLADKIGYLGGSLDKKLNKGLAIAGTGLLGFGTYAVKTASDLAEVENVVSVTFGGLADDVESWSKTTMESYGLTELETKKMIGTFGALMDKGKLSKEELLDMSKKMTGLVGDFSSFYNLSHEEAFEKLKAGIVGSTEPLESLGIDMREAAINTWLLENGVDKAFSKMSAEEQNLVRFNYIMEQGNKASGDFAETLETSLANQLRVATGEFTTMAQEVGQKLLPVVLEFIKWVRENSDTIIALASAVLGATIALKGMLIINTIIKTFKAWRDANTAITISQALLNLTVAGIPILIFAVIAVIGALVGAILYLWNTNEEFRNAIIQVWTNIKEKALEIWNNIVEFFTVTIPQAWTNCVEWFKKKGDEFNQWVQDTKTKVIAWFGEMVDKVVEFFTVTIPNSIDNVVKWFRELPAKIKSALSNLWDTMLGIGQDILKGLWEGILGAKDWLMEKIRGVGSWITDGFKKIFGISSPSKVFEVEIGYNLAKGLGLGFEEEMVDVNKEMQNAIDSNFDLPQANPKGSPMSAINDKSNITLNIYSPTPLTPSQVARETKKSLQDLAFNF